MELPTLDTSNEQRIIRKPKRPMRTYSKRVTTIDTSEPNSKKRRIDDTSSPKAPEDEALEPVHESRTRQLSPSLPPLQPTRKGTIMNYFKILPAISSSLPSSEPPSESNDRAHTPPSSPPVAYKEKKRRRLTTRIISRSASEDLNAQDSVIEYDEDDESDGVGDKVSPRGRMSVLSDTSADTLNQASTRRKNRSDSGKRGRGSKSAVVQTTLSLSSREKGFMECKDCNMLYNPLHKQDAKCHAKRHAAMLKAKSSNDNIKISD